MPTHETTLKVARFLVVGGTVMLVFAGLNWLFEPGLGKQVAFLVAYPPALVLHFLLNKWWTFGDQGAVQAKQMGEYLVMVAVTFVIQWAVFQAIIGWTPAPGWLAAALGNLAQVAITFFVMSRRIFSGRPSVP